MGKRIRYDDDFVVVTTNGREIYNGIEDYEPMKYELWKWNETEQAYFLKVDGKTYKKVCVSKADVHEVVHGEWIYTVSRKAD